MDKLIKYWYQDNFPDDELGEELRYDITFQDCWDFLEDSSQFDFDGDFYDWIGVGDSVVRERIFEELAELMDVDYDVVYNMWLDS